MIAVLIVNVVLDGAWLLHFLAHHRTGVTGALVGAVGWVGNRTHIPTLATHPGGHRPASRAAQKALREAHKAKMAALALADEGNVKLIEAQVLTEFSGEAVAA